jgi:hypothetical protein
MDPFADIDLDAEAIWLDGAWYTRQELAKRIKKLVDEGDFRVARPSEALERLEAELAATHVLSTRVPADLAAALAAAAKQTGRPVGRLVREAMAYYLAAAEAHAAVRKQAQPPSAEGDVSDDGAGPRKAFLGKKIG